MLSKIPKFVTTSELRKNLAKYLKHARKEPVLISIDRGERRGVILSDTTYNMLLEAFENMTDSRELTRLVDAGQKKPVQWNRVKYGV